MTFDNTTERLFSLYSSSFHHLPSCVC